jgi:dTDP-4-dehydrorhamnose 3,5-epimerase
MIIKNTYISGLKIIKSKNYHDNRGLFREVFKNKIINKKFIFGCLSKSKKNVLRGLHIQTINPQAKFISVIKGRIFDVILDLRKNSKSFGKIFKIILSEKNATSVFIPKGCAHGFLSLAKENIVYYTCDQYRNQKSEVGISWSDKSLRISWPTKKPILSLKDKKNITFNQYKNMYLK